MSRLPPSLVTLLALLLAPLAAQEGERPAGGAPGDVESPAGKATGASGEETPPGAALDLEDVIAGVRRKYPDLAASALHARELAARLLEAAAGARTGGEQSEATRLQFLATEILEAVGQWKAAQTLLLRMAGEGPRPEHRAEALYRLGLHYLLLQRYRDVWKYWKFIADLAPESEWVTRMSRYAPFIRMVTSGEVPDFRGRFGDLGERGRDDFKGQWLLIDFWSSTAPGARKAAGELRAAVEGARKRGWQGVVIGVNLDTERENFEKALAEWTRTESDPSGEGEVETPIITWPQHHDGRGFESPLVRAFGLPRVPLQVLIDPGGSPVDVYDPRRSLAANLRQAAGDSPR